MNTEMMSIMTRTMMMVILMINYYGSPVSTYKPCPKLHKQVVVIHST